MATKIALQVMVNAVPDRSKEDKPSLLDRVQYAIDCFECRHEPEACWAFIRKVNNAIQKKQPGSLNEKEKLILKAIRPIIMEHGFGDAKGLTINQAHMSALDETESEYKARREEETGR